MQLVNQVILSNKTTLKRDSLGKNILLGCVVALVFFGLIELVLMATGVTPLYKRTDPAVGFSGYAPLFQKHATPGGELVYNTSPNKTQWFNMQSFPVVKGDGVTRIFCLGGSTTYGRPYDDRTSFCGWLRLFLPEVDPSRQWEVINAGGISYASYRVARLMEELAEYEPDLFVVYSGHNEFLESRTYGKLLKVPEFLRSLTVQASRTRLYTVLYDLTYSRKTVLPTEVKALLDDSAGPEDYYRNDAMRSAILNDYKNSLMRMTSIGEKAGAKMIFVTPASNIGDFSPFKSEPGQDLNALDIRKIDSLKKVMKTVFDDGDHFRAEALAVEALPIDERDPDLHYLHAEALQALGRMDEARAAYIQSRDEDICPLRALTPMCETVAEVARKKNTGFIDFVGIMNAHSPDSIPGSELFLDHVHPTIEGNRLLALAIVDEMIQEGLVSPSPSWNEDVITRISSDLENSLDEKTHGIALRNLSKVLNWAGKHDEAARLVSMAADLIPEDGQMHAEKGIALWQAGDRDGALVHYREAVRLEPWNARAHRSLGVLLSELNRLDEAATALEEAVRMDPTMSYAYYDLGIVLQAQGQIHRAESAYRTAVKLDPTLAVAYNNLGIICAQRGDVKGAYTQFAKAVEADPDNKEAARNLERARMALGR